MLVLSRKKNERVTVELPDGRVLTFEVVEVRGDKVRVGIVAPRDVPVHREEVFEAIRKSA